MALKGVAVVDPLTMFCVKNVCQVCCKRPLLLVSMPQLGPLERMTLQKGKKIETPRCPLPTWFLLLRPPAGPRDRRDFDLGRMTGPTAQLRAKFHCGYKLPDLQFLSDLGQLARTCPFQLSEFLEEHGPVMYEQSASRHSFAEIFNAAQQRFPFLKGVMNWPLEARNYMGECLPQFPSPSNSFSTDERLFAWLGSGTGLP